MSLFRNIYHRNTTWRRLEGALRCIATTEFPAVTSLEWYVLETSLRRLEDIRLRRWIFLEVFVLIQTSIEKTYSKYNIKTKTKDVFKMSSRRLHQGKCLLGYNFWFRPLCFDINASAISKICFRNLSYHLCLVEKQKQPPVVFHKRAVLKNFAIVVGKHLRWSLFLMTLQAWMPATFIKRDYKFFPVNIVKFLRTYFKEHLRTAASGKEFLDKI